MPRKAVGAGRRAEPPFAPAGLRFSALDGLATFLKQGGNTLLIKGYAGAGKTTLALQLLRQLAPSGRGIYISSRVSESKVHRELPWTEFGARTGARFDDLRLGSPSYFLEGIMKAMSQKGKSSPLVVVLDTWDGIAKELDPGERLKAEKMLIAAADSSNARTIFVSEEPERTTMDYLVDGIVQMTREERFDRIFREVEVQKLRGTLIEQHKYLYTLQGGRFTLIPPHGRGLPSRPRTPAPVQDREGSMSFGSPELDDVFGGIRGGSSFSLVYDENVPYSALRLVTVPAMVNALNTGKAVFNVPLPGTTSQDVASAIEPHVSPEAFRDCLAIATVTGDRHLDPPLYPITGAQPKDATVKINEALGRVKSKSSSKSALLVESLGIFETIYASRLDSMVEAVGDRAGAVHADGRDAVMFVFQHDSPIASRILAVSGRYARLLTKDRSVVILGEKPSTPAYAVDHSSNPVLPSLTLIV